METKQKNAISLIVLVITILVLTILAATVIISLSNTNIISEANSSVDKTEAQQIKEAKSLMYVDGVSGNTPKPIIIGETILFWDEKSKSVVEQVNNNGKTIVDTVIIPNDFYYVGGTKDTGLVISDNSKDENKGVDYTCDGNQFVWVPVDDYFEFIRGAAEETAEGSGIYKMTDSLNSAYVEPYTVNDWEVKEYNDMCASVQKYGGFYIARFEAGDGDVIEARTGHTEAHTVVSKKGAVVYNYVPWGESMSSIAPFTKESVDNVAGAVYLSQNMYKGSTSVVSTLCYGVQWDAVMNFVSDAEHNIANSVSWGNYYDSIDEAAVNNGKLNMNYTTGRNEAWQAKNIYDLAGNMWEWTMEEVSSKFRVCRGGIYYTYGSIYLASNRGHDYPNNSYDFVGFRPVLYIK